MKFTHKQLKQKASYLFNIFELYHFKNDLEYNKSLNLVFEFCDYINQMPEWKLLSELQSQNKTDATNFKKMINQDINYWLDDYIKTICF